MTVEATPFPRLSFRDLDRSARYTVLCLDFTAPYPAFPIFAPVLHWFQTDLVPSAASPASPSATGLDGTEGEVVLEVPEGRGCVASYKSPHPPPGSSPHSYGFYLYKQGEEFHATSAGGEGSEGGGGGDGEMGNWKRVRFDLGVVEGMELVAANYFTSN